MSSCLTEAICVALFRHLMFVICWCARAKAANPHVKASTADLLSPPQSVCWLNRTAVHFAFPGAVRHPAAGWPAVASASTFGAEEGQLATVHSFNEVSPAGSSSPHLCFRAGTSWNLVVALNEWNVLRVLHLLLGQMCLHSLAVGADQYTSIGSTIVTFHVIDPSDFAWSISWSRRGKYPSYTTIMSSDYCNSSSKPRDN